MPLDVGSTPTVSITKISYDVYERQNPLISRVLAFLIFLRFYTKCWVRDFSGKIKALTKISLENVSCPTTLKRRFRKCILTLKSIFSPIKVQKCPCCHKNTSSVHDNRIQKIRDVKVFEKYCFSS